MEMLKAYILSTRLSPSPEGEGWDGGAFNAKSKASPSLALGKSSAFLFLAHPLEGEDFRAKALNVRFNY
jgi:hypothetical protein